MKELRIRTLSAILYGGVMLGAILTGPYTIALLALFINFFCLKELYGIVNAHSEIKIPAFLSIIFSELALLILILYATGLVPAHWLWAILAFPVLSSLMIFISLSYSFLSLLAGWGGWLYISLPMAAFILLGFHTQPFKPLFLLSALIFVWVNDTFAYFTGSLIGKHKLAPFLSPKKTWEGFAGGLIFTVISACLFFYLGKEVSFLHWIVLSVFTVIFSTTGDLFESLLKRNYGLKDSGHFLPGHGGFLDRFDSLLFVLPFYLVYLKIFALR